MKIEVDKIEDVFELLKLEEHTLYKVLVKHKHNNPSHEAYLFTGFKSGSYCYVTTRGDEGTPMMELYSMKVLKKLTKLK